MSKRVQVEEDEECLLLPYRENAVEWKEWFNRWFKNGRNQIPYMKRGMLETRCFIGWMSGLEYSKFVRSSSYCGTACIDIHYDMSYCVRKDFDYMTSFDTIQECLDYIRLIGLTPLDRGKTPFFAPAAARLARLAINAWCIVANRMGIPRDLRRLIGEKYLWPERHVWIP